jgi:hypothetical protein
VTASIIDSIAAWWFAIVLLVCIPLALLSLGIEKLQSWAGKGKKMSSAEREAMLMRRTRDEVRRHHG